MLDLLLDPEVWIAFAMLTALELVLGVDNVIFIAILADRLPRRQQERARRIGLFLALFMRIALLSTLAWLAGLSEPLFRAIGRDISVRDLVLIGGGLFLLWKSTREIHALLEGATERPRAAAAARLAPVVAQIALVDLVFSLDSIVTAVGMVDRLAVMMAAVIVSVVLMIVFAGAVARYIAQHPTLKMLALAFLVVVGVVLIADGFDFHVPKGYVYFAMAFSFGVEMLNLRLRRRAAR